MRKLVALLLGCLLAGSVLAKEAPTVAADPLLEKRAMALAEELRCLVCQNQTIADSHAELAVDLKNQIREKLKAGMSEAQIIDFMVARYGDFVLYRPPLKATTLPLWIGPFALLFAADAARRNIGVEFGELIAKYRQVGCGARYRRAGHGAATHQRRDQEREGHCRQQRRVYPE